MEFDQEALCEFCRSQIEGAYTCEGRWCEEALQLALEEGDGNYL